MADEKKYDLQIPPGTPDMEVILSEVIQKFGLELIFQKKMDDPYYLAVRGGIKSIKASKSIFGNAWRR